MIKRFRVSEKHALKSLRTKYMVKRFRVSEKHALKSLRAKYLVMISKNKKTPRHCVDLMILRHFQTTLRQNQAFSQHRGQQILTKIFLSKQAYKTEQKTYLHFFIAGTDLSQIRLLEFLR